MLGEERVIVSDIAGTTRDAIDLPLEVDGRKLVLVDTAGIRRQSKLTDSVEYYTVLRSQRAVERADVALVICDARDGVTAQDLRIAELAMQEGCATLLALNKWDLAPLTEDDLDHERAKVTRKLRLRPKVMTISAQGGRNVTRVLAEAITLGDRRRERIPTPGLNRFLAEAIDARQPPGQAGPPAEAALHGADRDAPAALRAAGQQPQPRDARLHVLPREPHARALRARRRAR